MHALEVHLPAAHHLKRWRGRLRAVQPFVVEEVIDFFVSHSWHDDEVAKYRVLEGSASESELGHARDPTLWLDKTCSDQSNIRDDRGNGCANLMACRQVLVFWGGTYPNRLWCIWELFTLVAFMSLDQATICICPRRHGISSFVCTSNGGRSLVCRFALPRSELGRIPGKYYSSEHNSERTFAAVHMDVDVLCTTQPDYYARLRCVIHAWARAFGTKTFGTTSMAYWG